MAYASTQAISTDYTVQAADMGTLIVSASDRPITVTLPASFPPAPNANPYPGATAVITILQRGHGLIHFVTADPAAPSLGPFAYSAGVGATVRAWCPGSSGPGASNTWCIDGGLFTGPAVQS